MHKFSMIFALLILALSSCVPAAQPGPVAQPGVPESAVEQRLTRAITSEPPSLDPHGAAGAGQNVLLPYLFDTLVYLDLDNTLQPYLAQTWSMADDGLSVTFTLRENIRFHNGDPLDAEAVKFSFERLMQQGQKSPLASMVTVIERIEAVDPVTVRFHLKEPSSTFLSSVANIYAGIVSPSAAQEAGEAFGRQPVGSGAFRLEAWEPGVSITLVKNPDYVWPPAVVQNQGAPHLDRLVFSILPDVAQQVTAFQAGEVDVLFINQTSYIQKLQADSQVEMVETTLNSLVYLGYNLNRQPFDDVRVREALSHAISKEEVVALALGGVGAPAFAPLAPTLPGFDPKLEQYELKFDLEKARALLEDAGFQQEGEQLLTPGGVPFRVTLLTSTRPPNKALATVIQSQLKALGVAVEIQMLDSAAAMEAAGQGNFDLLLWRYDWNDPDVLRVYLSTNRIGRTNRNFYSNPAVDELLEKAAHEMDEAQRNALYFEAQKHILQDAPWQPIYTPKDYIAIRKAVRGVVMGPMGRMLLNDVTRVE